MTKEVTVADFLDAMEKNGYEQAFGSFFPDKPAGTSVTADYSGPACAIGQAMLNLGAKQIFSIDFREGAKSTAFNALTAFIISANDVEKLPVPEVARKARAKFSYMLGFKISLVEMDEPVFKKVGV